VCGFPERPVYAKNFTKQCLKLFALKILSPAMTSNMLPDINHLFNNVFNIEILFSYYEKDFRNSATFII